MKAAEDIVRALARITDPSDIEDYACGICGSIGADDVVANHSPDCAWRMAREWVDAHAPATVVDLDGNPLTPDMLHALEPKGEKEMRVQLPTGSTLPFKLVMADGILRVFGDAFPAKKAAPLIASALEVMSDERRRGRFRWIMAGVS